MKTNIKVTFSNKKGRRNNYLRDSEIGDGTTINLTDSKSRQYNTSKRRVAKRISIMPTIAKGIGTLGLLFIIIGSLGKLNAEEIKFEEIIEKPTINAEDKKPIKVEKIEKPVIKVVESVKPIKKVETSGLPVTAVVKPTVKNGGLKNDEVVILAAMNFIKKFEGMHLKAYHDYKQYSICYGTKSYKGEVTTKEICDKRLRERVQNELLRINRTADSLHWRKKVALISFFYNSGYKHNIMNYAARGDDKSVKFLVLQYNSAGGKFLQGLQNRRYAELAYYSKIK